jgi:molybdopterin converting factor small subunit
MRVTVHLHTILQRPSPEGLQRVIEVELPAGATLAQLIDVLEIELPMDAVLTAVNGRTAGLECALANGDQVRIMPAMSGGGK